MTAKTLRNKQRIDRTPGVSREQGAINRKNKLESSKRSSDGTEGYRRAIKHLLKLQSMEAALVDAELKRCAAEEELFFKLPDRVVPGTTFEEKSFGYSVPSDQKIYQDLSSMVVSLALFDGDKMLFACSGIPLPRGNSKLHLTRFVTSAHLVEEFNKNRYKDDQLRVEVCLPDRRTINGFLGLYDKDIAIVTSFGLQAVHPVDLDVEATVPPDDRVLAVGRAFKSGSLMTMDLLGGDMVNNTWFVDGQNYSEAVLGGPLVVETLNGSGVSFLGMNLHCCNQCANEKYNFLPQKLLHERLKHFQILNPKQLHFREYLLPDGVSSIVPSGVNNHASNYSKCYPLSIVRRILYECYHIYHLCANIDHIIASGFVRTINRMKSLGYPLPPPLMLELNGELLNSFEGYFGEVRAWKGYPFGYPPVGSEKCVWEHLSKKVVTNISRRVVSLASFNGPSRFFACTGLLIKWNMHTFILTSASLVRSRLHHEKFDNSLTIEVFLPPNQRVSGTLELYNLNYNFAIVSVKNLHAICPEDIFNQNPKASKVVAVGRDADQGLLMGSIGEVKHRNKETKLNSRDLKLSTCRINKAGIGGPLVDFDGSFVGMNFYEGSKVTPFLPKSKIVNALRGVKNFPPPLERCLSYKGFVVPMQINNKGTPVLKAQKMKTRYHVPMLRGRTLH